MEWIDVDARVRCAFDALEHRDLHLLENDANERTICARLAMYLQSVFPGYDVDVEYNRHGMDPKRIGVNPEGDEELVYPDLVVHHRGNDDCNLLIIEVKKSSNPETRHRDRAKLEGCVKQFKYRFAVLVDLRVGVLPTARRREQLDRVHPPSAGTPHS